MNSKRKLKIVAFLTLAAFWAGLASAENIDPCDDGSQYACGPKLGRINFEL